MEELKAQRERYEILVGYMASQPANHTPTLLSLQESPFSSYFNSLLTHTHNTHQTLERISGHGLCLCIPLPLLLLPSPPQGKFFFNSLQTSNKELPCFSQKSGSIVGATKASFFGGRKLRVSKFAAPSGTRSVTVCAAADPDRPLWFPGSTPPPWLDGSLPGDFGFDPLGLASGACALQMGHVRCCGHFHPRVSHQDWHSNTPSWYTAGEQEYFTDTTTLFIIELILIGWAEGRRWADIIKPGCVNTDPIFPNNKLTGTDVGYPGGLWFDPLGWGSGSPQKIKELRTKEIKNGRLAMLAVMGAWFQHIYTGTGPSITSLLTLLILVMPPSSLLSAPSERSNRAAFNRSVGETPLTIIVGKRNRFSVCFSNSCCIFRYVLLHL
ncbi:UNVERIFIED_CONTAM: Chlorophyll a-b binding protein, chloroplastic [Sesamum calycinum]|uniref:Chlorophyll a-b binding protein, chloroplastic n=1 Tax=Sesamum calycinum TaxID=2727403 RepID=A0AAW2PPQ3_9LAMI